MQNQFRENSNSPEYRKYLYYRNRFPGGVVNNQVPVRGVEVGGVGMMELASNSTLCTVILSPNSVHFQGFEV